MQFRSRLKSTSILIDLTPLVDVVLLILIFFILTSDILPLKSLLIENPTLDREAPPLTTQILVVVDAQHVVYLGHQKEIVSLSSLTEHLSGEISRVRQEHLGADPTVVLSMDRRVDYGTFLRVFSLAQECSEKIRLVYQYDEELAHAER